MLNSTDKFLVNDGSVTETVNWSEIVSEANPMVVSVVITPDEPEVNEAATATPVTTGGDSPYTYTYQWVTADNAQGLNQTELVGATTNTYTPVSADTGKFLGCVVVSTDDAGNTSTGTGYATNAVELALVIAKPSILTPEDGAGIGGDTSYYPETSEIIAGGVEVIENGINPEPYLGATAVYTGNASEAESKNPDGIIEDVPGANWYVSFLQSGGSSGNAKLTYPISIPSTDKVSIEVKTSGFTSSATGKFKLIVNGDNGDKFVEFSDADIFFEQTKTYDINGVQGVKGITLERTGQDLLQTGLSLNNIAVDDVIVGKSYISETKLTFTNDKAFNSADGTEMSTIDQAFKAGDKVVGEGDATVFADSPCFATDTYSGNGGTQKRTTGIDNTNKSLVWIKNRTDSRESLLYDTLRGPEKSLYTEGTAQEQFIQNSLTSFSDDGFTLSRGEARYNESGKNYVAWNFRGAPGFFDVVTYEGTNNAVQNSSSLFGVCAWCDNY